MPAVKQQLRAMSLNARGLRDRARGLRISTNTGRSELRKKATALASVNTAWLHILRPDEITVHVARAGAVEMEEM